MTAELLRMAHATDPDTSFHAAVRALRGTKKGSIQGQILNLLASCGPLTAKELHFLYDAATRNPAYNLPPADLYDIRRRLTELKRDLGSVVDSGQRRNGEAVMQLKETES